MSYQPGQDVLLRRPDGGGIEKARAFTDWSSSPDHAPPDPIPRASRRPGSADSAALMGATSRRPRVPASPPVKDEERVVVEEESA